MPVQTETETETACLSGVGLADKILACHLRKQWEASNCSDKDNNNVQLNEYDDKTKG